MKKIGTILLSTGTLAAIVVFCAMSLGKQGDTWWYVHGAPYYWHYQADVFAFRTVDRSPWNQPLDNDCVARLVFRSQHHDKLHIIYFKPECDDNTVSEVKNSIRSHAAFGAEFPVITRYPELTYGSGAWFAVDDLLLVNFNPDSLDVEKFVKFKQDHHLKQINFPDSIFPEGIFTYVFEFDAQGTKPTSGIELSRTIYMLDSGLVLNVQPNLINAFEDVGGTATGQNPINQISNEDLECYVVNSDNNLVTMHVIGNGIEHEKRVIKVYDLFGRTMGVFFTEPGKYSYEINTSDYAGGIYFAGIENELGKLMAVRKFVKL